jgi:hypothetical protein
LNPFAFMNFDQVYNLMGRNSQLVGSSYESQLSFKLSDANDGIAGHSIALFHKDLSRQRQLPASLKFSPWRDRKRWS